MIGDVLSMLFALAGTVCVILLTYYVSKWYARTMGPVAGSKHIKVIDRLVLSKTGSVVVIDVEGDQYLIGVSDQNVQILKEIEKPIPLPKLDSAEPPGFQNLSRLIKRWRGVN